MLALCTADVLNETIISYFAGYSIPIYIIFDSFKLIESKVYIWTKSCANDKKERVQSP